MFAPHSVLAANGFSDALHALKEMGYHALLRLPFIAVAVVVFFVFFFVAKGVRSLVRRLSGERRRAHNAGIVFGRLAMAAIIIVGLMIALVIAVPSIKAGDVIRQQRGDRVRVPRGPAELPRRHPAAADRAL